MKFYSKNLLGGDIMVTRKNDEKVREYEAKKLERQERLRKLYADKMEEDPDYTLDKFYENYMDGPY